MHRFYKNSKDVYGILITRRDFYIPVSTYLMLLDILFTKCVCDLYTVLYMIKKLLQT